MWPMTAMGTCQMRGKRRSLFIMTVRCVGRNKRPVGWSKYAGSASSAAGRSSSSGDPDEGVPAPVGSVLAIDSVAVRALNLDRSSTALPYRSANGLAGLAFSRGSVGGVGNSTVLPLPAAVTPLTLFSSLLGLALMDPPCRCVSSRRCFVCSLQDIFNATSCAICRESAG